MGRFTRFCLECLKQTPQDAGTPALTAYLSYLALERNVSDSTQKQALNALVFLTKKVFGVEEFTIDKPAHGNGNRRPPVVLSRREVAAVLAHMEDLLQSGTDIRTVQDLMGHTNVSTTMIYLHVMQRPGAGGPSPLNLP